jgi:uncharacterized protein YuzE
MLEEGMKVRYDAETDTLTLLLRSSPVHESDEDKPGVILDYDKDGNVVGIEILDASKRVEDPQRIEYLPGAPAR